MTNNEKEILNILKNNNQENSKKELTKVKSLEDFSYNTINLLIKEYTQNKDLTKLTNLKEMIENYSKSLKSDRNWHIWMTAISGVAFLSNIPCINLADIKDILYSSLSGVISLGCGALAYNENKFLKKLDEKVNTITYSLKQ